MFSEEATAGFSDLLPALGPLEESLAIDRPPVDFKAPAAEDVLAKLVEPQKHCATAAKAAELRAEVASLDGVLLALVAGRDDGVINGQNGP